MAKRKPLDYDDRVGKSEVLFEVRTPLGFTVSVKSGHWETIVSIKHPVMAGAGRWICAVVKRLNGEAFLITTYPTDAIKEGEPIWKS